MNSSKTTQQQPPICSWAEKVRVSDSSTRCALDRLARKPVGSVLTIPKDMQLDNIDIWQRSMVGFFVSYKMPFHAVQAVANRIWKSMGLEKTTVMANGFMIFRFSSVTAMEEVLARGPWMFGGKAILLQQWQPGFQFDKNKIKTIPVWVRLQGLPFPLWNKKGLSMAASMVGRPLASDEATIQCTRLEFARVCVEIDASIPLVHNFQVQSSLSDEPITVDVSYEWKPSKCDSCKVFGHSCKAQGRKDNQAPKIMDAVQLPEPKAACLEMADKAPLVKEATINSQQPTGSLDPPLKENKKAGENGSLSVGTEAGENCSLSVGKETGANCSLNVGNSHKASTCHEDRQGRGKPSQPPSLHAWKIKWIQYVVVQRTKVKEWKWKPREVALMQNHQTVPRNRALLHQSKLKMAYL
ncbi:hypothetical protein OIU84_023946 [Salix udensis]|uniref:DUF4283 domain-containing protein n=1 Tax=Salix udensis TaxID=889485 RepID=A0AAD6PAR6_9ROSI|nr:hypothetical protein OIU84_023946 [Salix udensis]